MLTQMFILEPTNVELAASNRFKQGLVFLIKEVESGVTALVINNRLRAFVQMLDAGSLDPRVEVVAHLVLVIPSQLSAKKGRDVLRLHRVNRGSCQGLVNLLQIALPGKNDICRVLRLHEAPMILHVEMLNDGAEVLSKLVQGPMQSLNIQFGRQSLGLFPVGDRAKGIVDHRERYPMFAQLRRQPAMPIEIDLQSEGAPRRYAHVAEP